MSSIGLGIAGAGVLISGVEGGIQLSDAAKERKQLRQPVDQIPQEFIENRNIAKQLAQIGLPQEEYNRQMNAIRESQANATAAANRSGRPGQAGQIQSATNTATGNLAAEDAQARQNNQRFFLQENAALGARKDQQEQANVFDPYTRQYNEAQATQGAGLQNINNAISGLGQVGLAYSNYQQGNQSSPSYQQQSFANRSSAPTLTASGTPAPAAYTPPNPFGGTTPYYPPGSPQWMNYQPPGLPPYNNPYFPNATQ